MVTNHHAMRSRDNIYDFRDSPSTKTLASKAQTDTTSIRSPSSLAMTQKSGSQSSLKSAISLKESNGTAHSPYHVSGRQTRVETDPRGGGGQVPRSTITNGTSAKSVEEKRLLQQEPQPISSTPIPPSEPYKVKVLPTNVPMSSRSITPVPSARTTTTTTTLSSAPIVQQKAVPIVQQKGAPIVQQIAAPTMTTARTQVIEGVPQTSV